MLIWFLNGGIEVVLKSAGGLHFRSIKAEIFVSLVLTDKSSSFTYITRLLTFLIGCIGLL